MILRDIRAAKHEAQEFIKRVDELLLRIDEDKKRHKDHKEEMGKKYGLNSREYINACSYGLFSHFGDKPQGDYIPGCKNSGAIKRASGDLSAALVTMRNRKQY